jgi:hydroxymethylglutaryl-CoA lyase
MYRACAGGVPQLPVALHFHNTRGLGLVNVMEGLAAGITAFEASLGGIAGCPFAPGATRKVLHRGRAHAA